ncbi:MAG: TCR/Tet family MFS transporter [Methylobacterium mesophilicum]|nr:TCR/Tet family MFS transporter [Methylobacterium mesophilicum]
MIAPHPSRRKAAIAFILVTAVLDIMAMGLVIPVLPALIEEFTGSNASAGWINGVFVALWAGMQFLASPVIGSLSDRFGRRPVILLSCAGMAADWVLMALAPNLWWLALGRLVAGVTSSSFTTVFAYMADITPVEGRARAYGLIGAAFGGGFILGPLIGGVLGDYDPRLPFWLAAGLSALAFLYGAFVLPESLAAGKRMAFSWRRANPLGALALLRSHRDLSGLAFVTFLLYFAHHVFSAVYVLYAAHRFGWTPGQVGILLGCAGVIDMTVQGLLVGPATKRFGDRATMILGLFGGALGLLSMGLAPTGPLFALALIPNGLWGLAMPTLQSLMTRRVSESEQGQLQGANNSVASIAGIVAPAFFGAVYAATATDGLPLALSGLSFAIAAAVLALAGVVGALVARHSTPSPEAEPS